jgi:hypothetical protein
MESTAVHSPPRERHGRASIFTLAFVVVLTVAGAAFLAGWLIGRILS